MRFLVVYSLYFRFHFRLKLLSKSFSTCLRSMHCFVQQVGGICCGSVVERVKMRRRQALHMRCLQGSRADLEKGMSSDRQVIHSTLSWSGLGQVWKGGKCIQYLLSFGLWWLRWRGRFSWCRKPKYGADNTRRSTSWSTSLSSRRRSFRLFAHVWCCGLDNRWRSHLTDRGLTSLWRRSQQRGRDGLADRRTSTAQIFSTRYSYFEKGTYLPGDRRPISVALWDMISNRALFVP